MMQQDRIESTIAAMRRQEESGYACRDYLYQQREESDDTPLVGKGPLSKVAVTSDERAKMVQWCYKVVDYCKFHRETVSIATSCLDRFLQTTDGRGCLDDAAAFQLAAMTSLYTSVKVHEPEVMNAELVSDLSRGAHTSQEVEAMERLMLRALKWRINAPTSLAFVRLYLELLPSTLLSPEMKRTANELSKFQTELAIADYALIQMNASTVAFAAVLNSLESMGADVKVFHRVRTTIGEAALIQVDPKELFNVQERLYQAVMVHAGPTTCLVRPPTRCAPQKAQRRSSYDTSPCSVSMQCEC